MHELNAKFTNFSRFPFGKVFDNSIKSQTISKLPLYGEDCQVCKPCLTHCRSKIVLYELQFGKGALAAGNANSSGKEDAEQDNKLNIRDRISKATSLYEAQNF
jgi:hypothetical protein